LAAEKPEPLPVWPWRIIQGIVLRGAVMTLLDEGKTSAKDDFLRELADFGIATHATQQRLADELAAQKKPGQGKRRGPKPKVARNLEARAWFLVATDKAGYKKGQAYDQLGKKLNQDGRAARRIVNNKLGVDYVLIVMELPSAYLCSVFFLGKNTPKILRAPGLGMVNSYLNIKRRFKEWEDAHLYLFEKSTFDTGKI
jgi:hypothetical protein